MTDQRLRDLLEGRVADLTTVDLVDGAWRRRTEVRRRRLVVGASGLAVAAVVAVAVVVTTGGSGGPSPAPPASSPAPTRTADWPSAVRAGSYGGVPVWWAPPTSEEGRLPAFGGTPLPARIDLSDGRPAMPAGMRAVAVFQVWGDQPGAVVAVGADGTSYSLDTSRLQEVRDGGGNPIPSVTQESLSPDGRSAFFIQQDSLEIFDFDAGTWATATPREPDVGFDQARWAGPGEIAVPVLTSDAGRRVLYDISGRSVGSDHGGPFGDVYVGPTADDEAYGPIERNGTDGARGMFLAGPVTGVDGEGYSAVEALGAGGTDTPAGLLAFPRNRADDGRWLQCCPAVGWIGPETVLFESRWAGARVLAWRVGTRGLYRVSDIVGWAPGQETYVASFADLDR